MQLKLSIATAALLISVASQAQDYVTFQYLQYNENDDRTTVSAPSIMLNKDFGANYTLNASFVGDAVSGASPTFYSATGSLLSYDDDEYDDEYDDDDDDDYASSGASSGASAFARGRDINATDVKFGNINYDDKRFAGSLALTSRFASRDELTIGMNYSSEKDFYSTEASIEYMHWLDELKNQSVSLGFSYQYNEILVTCVENSACSADAASGASEAMDANLINVQLGFSQNINSQSYAKVAIFAVIEDGYLTNPYMNVVRNYNESTNKADIVAENRPDSKTAYGVSIKYANALTDKLSLQLAYRYYTDDWGIDSNTLDGDIYYEYNSDILLKFGLRGYIQSEADFYNASKDYFTDEIFASSDQRMSDFSSITYKTDVNYVFSEEWSANISANFYSQSTKNNAMYFMTGFRYNF